MYSLKQVKHRYGFDRGLRASLNNMKDVGIPMPLNKDGDFDLDAQREFAKICKAVDQLKREVSDRLNALITQKVAMRI
jgi:hypothetical protein